MRETGTFSFILNESNANEDNIYEFFNAEDVVDDVVGNVDGRIKYSVGLFIESLRLTVHLPSFVRADFPATYPEDSAAEKASKLLEVENKFPKTGVKFYRRKRDNESWIPLSTILLQNRGRESQLSVLIPYLTVNQVKILSRTDRLGVGCVDYGDGLIGGGAIESRRGVDFVQLEGEYRLDIDTDDNLPRPIYVQQQKEDSVTISAKKLISRNVNRAYFELQNTGEAPIKMSYSQSGLSDPIVIYPGQLYYPLVIRGLVITDEVWVQAINTPSTVTIYDYSLSY
jgi:hypothetical protein